MRVVAAEGLQKRFGQRLAVAGIDFEVNKGECLGFLGPNGAGKTTTIQIMLGLVEKTAGELTIFGQEVPEQFRQIKSRIGVVPQNDNLDSDLTVFENLVTYASYYNLVGSKAKGRAGELLDYFALENRRNDVIEHLSGGQRRRLLLARALMHDPDLLILDEPTVGLDPQARYLMWQRLKALKENGVTMMLTSHYMDEVARLSDRVLIIDQGKVIVEGEPGRLVNDLVGVDVFEVLCSAEDAAQLAKSAKECGARSEIMPEGIFLYMHKDCHGLSGHVRPLQQWVRRPANLEDLFIQLTGRSLHET